MVGTIKIVDVKTERVQGRCRLIHVAIVTEADQRLQELPELRIMMLIQLYTLRIINSCKEVPKDEVGKLDRLFGAV